MAKRKTPTTKQRKALPKGGMTPSPAPTGPVRAQGTDPIWVRRRKMFAAGSGEW